MRRCGRPWEQAAQEEPLGPGSSSTFRTKQLVVEMFRVVEVVLVGLVDADRSDGVQCGKRTGI